MGAMMKFAVPMILGDILQQCYNIADTLIVSQTLSKYALAAVGDGQGETGRAFHGGITGNDGSIV
jgi:Na+-driven multidrug efflux pump